MLRRRVWRPSVCLPLYPYTSAAAASLHTCVSLTTTLPTVSHAHSSQLCSAPLAGGVFHASRVLHAPRGPRTASPRPEPTPRHTPAADAAAARAGESEAKAEQQHAKEEQPSTTTYTSDALPESPFDCMIDTVLPPQSSADTAHRSQLPTTLRALVQLLIDPAATHVEDVPLSVFVAMLPRRQLAALNENKAWHEVVLASERYQGYKDARALRLAGVTSVGKWELQPDRVPLSAYSRGVLEQTYHTIVRQARRGAQSPSQSQQSEVMAWLSKTIHKAILDEFASANQANTQLLLPLIGTLPRTEAVQAAAHTTDASPSHPDTTSTGSTNKAAEAVEQQQHAEDDDTADDFERLMREDEEQQQHKVHEEAKAAQPHEKAKKSNDEERRAMAASGKQDEAATAAAEAEGEEGEDDEGEEIIEEIVEEIEEVEDEGRGEEVEEEGGGSSSAPKAVAQDNATVNAELAAAANKKGAEQEEEKDDSTLVHLAQLMLRQFNSADGYLHHTKKELRADEKSGYVIAIDEDTAQVDPLALFSTFHTASPAARSPVAVRALKEIWSSYNAHQLALEAALGQDEASVAYHKEKSVEALVHGAVLLRAISREDVTSLKAVDALPAFGFPLLSSDTRPYAQRRPRSSAHTDMNARRVQDAVLAYRSFFADKECRAMPFRPAVECNAGCGVVMLSGTTLHLYETSMKESVQEEQVRIHFAEAMLGVLHVLREKIIPRVNTVHYHILVTKLAGGSSAAANHGAEDMDGMMSATTIVSVDLTGPFTNAERHRLRALAEPLGLAREVAEFGCVEDIVMELEESTRASVVHDLLQSREDLEALLTPTLAQLLPEDDEVAALDEGAEEGEEEEGAAAAASNDASKGDEGEEEESEVSAVAARSEGKARSKPRKKEAKAAVQEQHHEDEEEVKQATEEEGEEEVEDDWSEEVEEEATASRAASHRNKAQGAARSYEAKEDTVVEEEEEEEEVRARRGAAAAGAQRKAQPASHGASSRGRPASHTAAAQSKRAFEYATQVEVEEEEEEGHEDETTTKAAQGEEEEEEVYEEEVEEEVDEEQEQTNVAASHRAHRDSPSVASATTPPTNTSARRSKGTRHGGTPDVRSTRAAEVYEEEEEAHEDSAAAASAQHDADAEEEEEEDDNVVRHVRGRKAAMPSIPPRTARVPVPEDYYEEEAQDDDEAETGGRNEAAVSTRQAVPARRTVVPPQQQQQQQQASAVSHRRAAPRHTPAASYEAEEEEQPQQSKTYTPAPARRSPVSPLRQAGTGAAASVTSNVTPVAMPSQGSVTVRRPAPRERPQAQGSPATAAAAPPSASATPVARPARSTPEAVVHEEEEAVYEAAEQRSSSSSSAAPQEQWFKRRPKKRYFS